MEGTMGSSFKEVQRKLEMSLEELVTEEKHDGGGKKRRREDQGTGDGGSRKEGRRKAARNGTQGGTVKEVVKEVVTEVVKEAQDLESLPNFVDGGEGESDAEENDRPPLAKHNSKGENASRRNGINGRVNGNHVNGNRSHGNREPRVHASGGPLGGAPPGQPPPPGGAPPPPYGAPPPPGGRPFYPPPHPHWAAYRGMPPPAHRPPVDVYGRPLPHYPPYGMPPPGPMPPPGTYAPPPYGYPPHHAPPPTPGPAPAGAPAPGAPPAQQPPATGAAPATGPPPQGHRYATPQALTAAQPGQERVAVTLSVNPEAQAAEGHRRQLYATSQQGGVGGSEKTPPGFQVRLTNVPSALTARDLAEAFGEVSTGRVESVDLLRDSSGRATGEAVVVFTTMPDAQNAVRRYNGGDLNGRRLVVTFEGDLSMLR